MRRYGAENPLRNIRLTRRRFVFTAGASVAGILLLKRMGGHDSLPDAPEEQKEAEPHSFKTTMAFIRGTEIEDHVDLEQANFDSLSTLAYFAAPLDREGNILRGSRGYEALNMHKTKRLFEKAKAAGTDILLTVTQFNNTDMETLLGNSVHSNNAIRQIVQEVNSKGFGGANIDFEYDGDAGELLRQQFSQFIRVLKETMHRQVKSSQISVSVIPSAGKQSTLYDIAKLSQVADSIVMMAYEYGSPRSSVVMPTAPMGGATQGKYWGDIATDIDAFLLHMPAEKLTVALPLYGLAFTARTPDMGVCAGRLDTIQFSFL